MIDWKVAAKEFRRRWRDAEQAGLWLAGEILPWRARAQKAEADLATERARADALAIENAELRAALEPFAAIRFQGEAEERASALLAADPSQRGAELLAVGVAMREALVRLTPGPHIGAMSGPESEGVRALMMWDRAQADLRGGRTPKGES